MKRKQKGRSGELELVAVLRNLGFTGVHAGACTSYGTEPDIWGLKGIHVEVKRVERLNLWAAMRQSISDSVKFHDGRPAVFHRRNRQPWLVTMRLDDWARLYKAAMKQPPRRATAPQEQREVIPHTGGQQKSP